MSGLSRLYGLSTHLFHESRLCREHLAHIAAHGFDTVELFATRSHFDYHDEEATTRLSGWLSDARLALHSVHAPIFADLRGGRWIGAFSNASGDESCRKAAVAETRAALQVARHIPYHFLVVHLGMPAVEPVPQGDNQPDAARRSVEEIVALAADAGIRVAIEVIPNAMSSAAALVRLIEDQLDGLDVGICLDYGHAHLMGDLGEAIETISGHLWTTHVHDNIGRRDDHLVPFAGTIDWEAAIMETLKIGYDEPLIFEVANTGNPLDVLERSAKARARLEAMFVTY